MSEFVADTRLDFLACVAVLLVLFATRSRWLRHRSSVGVALLVFVGLTGAAAFFNFGDFRHYYDRGFVNRWEQLHYHLGSRYFDELGHYGLYAASIAAQRQSLPGMPLPEQVRDLRTDQLVDLDTYSGTIDAVVSRFSPERWSRFVRDHSVFLTSTPLRFWQRIRSDYGYNATPFWTVVASLVAAPLPARYESLVALGLVDSLLLAAAYAGVFATFGLRAGCISLAIAGLGYGWHYIYLGAFLRLDWFAALLFGMCLVRREWFASAGACFAYAACARLIPAALLIGPALLAVREWRQLRTPSPPRWALRLGVGAASATALGLLLGSTTDTGFAAWSDFADRMTVYRASWSGNMVGLDSLALHGPEFLRFNLEQSGIHPDPEALLEERSAQRWLARIALLSVVLVAMWRSARAESFLLGLGVWYAVSAPGAYYWIALAAVPLVRERVVPIGILALWTALHGVELMFPDPPHMTFRFALMSWGLLALLLGWATLVLWESRAGGRGKDELVQSA